MLQGGSLPSVSLANGGGSNAAAALTCEHQCSPTSCGKRMPTEAQSTNASASMHMQHNTSHHTVSHTVLRSKMQNDCRLLMHNGSD
jgi:hypothetical protein